MYSALRHKAPPTRVVSRKVYFGTVAYNPITRSDDLYHNYHIAMACLGTGDWSSHGARLGIRRRRGPGVTYGPPQVDSSEDGRVARGGYRYRCQEDGPQFAQATGDERPAETQEVVATSAELAARLAFAERAYLGSRVTLTPIPPVMASNHWVEFTGAMVRSRGQSIVQRVEDVWAKAEQHTQLAAAGVVVFLRPRDLEVDIVLEQPVAMPH